MPPFGLVWRPPRDARTGGRNLESAVRKADVPVFAHYLRCLAVDPRLVKAFEPGKGSPPAADPQTMVERLEVLFKECDWPRESRERSRRRVAGRSVRPRAATGAGGAKARPLRQSRNVVGPQKEVTALAFRGGSHCFVVRDRAGVVSGSNPSWWSGARRVKRSHGRSWAWGDPRPPPSSDASALRPRRAIRWRFASENRKHASCP